MDKNKDISMSISYKAIAVDDELHCLDTLSWELNQNCPNVELIGKYQDAEEAFEVLQEADIDIAVHNNKRPVVSKTLSHTEEVLKPHSFLRMHKSYFINLRFLKRYIKNSGGYVELDDGTTAITIKFTVI